MEVLGRPIWMGSCRGSLRHQEKDTFLFPYGRSGDCSCDARKVSTQSGLLHYLNGRTQYVLCIPTFLSTETLLILLEF